MTTAPLYTLKVNLALKGPAAAAGFTPIRVRKVYSWTTSESMVRSAERTIVILKPKFGPQLEFSNQNEAIHFCRGVIWGREHRS